jgi:hypothetical protein
VTAVDFEALRFLISLSSEIIPAPSGNYSVGQIAALDPSLLTLF